LPEAILRHHVALGLDHIFGRACADVRDAPAVALDTRGPLEAGDAVRARSVQAFNRAVLTRATNTAEFGMPEVRLGVPTIVGAMRLPQRIGKQSALEILLTGDRIDAARAKEIGLAGRVVPRAALLDEARALARRLCQGAPLAVRAVKEMAYRGQYLPWVDAVRMGETMRRVAAQTDDAREGMAAAREGREPRWQGH